MRLGQKLRFGRHPYNAHVCPIARWQDRWYWRKTTDLEWEREYDHDSLVGWKCSRTVLSLTHGRMRSMHDAILVGIDTVLNDNPQLNSPYGPLHLPQG
jgi:hypothetical protein